jgi:lysophospholipase L1-like esterase
MRDTVETLRAAAPGLDVVLVHVPVVAIAGVEELNGRYDELATELDTEDERVVVAYADEGFVSDPSAPASDSYDGLHPSESGEVKIADAVAAALVRLGIGEDG